MGRSRPNLAQLDDDAAGLGLGWCGRRLNQLIVLIILDH